VLASGVLAPRRLTDVVPILLDHFGIGTETAAAVTGTQGLSRTEAAERGVE
jgi:hypothetical protein